ncbi:phage host specificity protein [Escherichia coli]|nr:phage terminase large subunit family protein [Escherichia coli]GCH38371.1 phage host specificity protein [Escherichia coli]
MNISNSQVNRLRHFVRAGLRSLFRPEPQTAVEWADANYYLPKESAYQEGRWETLPFQRAIMNAMGSDYVREVNVVKSARVGYSKMLLGVYAYFIEHKQRNTLIWLPTDGDAENFMKTHVEPTIRDIPSLLALAPWYGKKHRDNTLTMKRFSNGRGFWCLGGKAAKNYREKSVDVAGYDELAAFDEDIEQEGSPTFLGDKRIEGSVWPKSIRGSTPKVRGTCQIERAASESPHFMRFHVACPHCGEEQYLKFGDKETPFGLKWTPDDPSSVFYLCEHNGWETATELVEDTQAILRYGRNVTKMDAFGCTSRGQAHRAGLWLIKTELLETQTVDFSVGAEGLRHVPGDVIEICDDDYAGISTGGRVLAVNSQTRTLTLDREITLPSSGTTLISLVDGSGNPVSVEVQSVTDGVKVKVSRVPDGVAGYSVWGLKLPTLRQRLFRCVSIRENDDGTYAITAVQHVPEKEAIVDNGAHFDGDQSGTVNGVTPPAVQHLTAEVTADSGEYQVLARWDTPKVVKGVSFMLRLTVAADDGSERLVSTARTTETTYRFRQLALGRYTLTVRAVNARGQQGDPASVSFRIAAPAAPSRIELTPGYFQITATPHLAVYDPTVQFEFWFSEKRIADIRQVETTARYLGTALYWIAASINIRPGHNYYFYVRSVNTVGKSAFVEAVGQPSDDASGYLDFFKGEIGKTHLAQELWTQIDNGQLAPDLAEIRTSITDVSNEITQTVNKKLEDQSAAIQQIQKVQADTNNNLNSMWAVKLQQMQDGRLYIAGIGAGIENTPDGMQSQVLLAADRIAMINPANGNTKPMFVGQGDQIFMNEVFLKYLTAPTITSGGNPPAFSLTPDGKLTAKNADISGSVNANSGTLNNVTINENCQIKGKLSANQIEGDIVKTVGKAFPRDSRAPERWPSGTITVRIYDDQPFDRQIVIPAVAFCGAKHERENNDIYSSCRLIVKKNGAEIYNRTALDNTLIYSGVIDMPAGHGHMTLEFSVSAWLVNDWYPTASISDLLVVVMKKATAGISIS